MHASDPRDSVKNIFTMFAITVVYIVLYTMGALRLHH